jgi:hypothetical protein
MSLIGDYKNVLNMEELTKDQIEKAKLQYFCFAMMAVCIPEVTDKNVGETWLRLSIVQQQYGGGWFSADGVSYDYSFEDVARFVGYKTNTNYENSTTWFRNRAKNFADTYQQRYEKQSLVVA